MTASDEAGIYSNVKIVSSSITTNNGGTAVLQNEINNFVGADYSSTEIAANLKFGERVRIAAGQVSGDVKKGAVYEWMGEDETTATDLATQDYTDLSFWKPVRETKLVPQGVNFTKSDSAAIGGAIVLNDVTSSVAASISGGSVNAGKRDRGSGRGGDDRGRRRT